MGPLIPYSYKGMGGGRQKRSTASWSPPKPTALTCSTPTVAPKPTDTGTMAEGLNTRTEDRVAGVLLGQACGDALGVPYEFGPPLSDDFVPRMVGGGWFDFPPAEYSDDTAMTVRIGAVGATGAELTTQRSLDKIAMNFLDWATTARDVGRHTAVVFNRTREILAADPQTPAGAAMRSAAADATAIDPHSAGNGALMRTSVVALTSPGDRIRTANTARAVASLTHPHPLAVESCVLWTEAIRLAVTTGRCDLLPGLDLLPDRSRDQWQAWIAEATQVDPRTFTRNGYTVTALQAAWAAITWTPIPAEGPKHLLARRQTRPAEHFEHALMNAVRSGDDTDTVAAIAGGLLGGMWGRSAIPKKWATKVHGYGPHDADSLVSMASEIFRHGTTQ